MSRFVKTALPMLAGATLFLCFHVGTWEAVTHLPGITAPPPPYSEDGGGANWFGHGPGVIFAFGLLLFLAIYVGKRLITQSGWSVPAAVLWYCLGIAASLPYIWFFVVPSWRYPHAFPITCWIYEPVTVWAVPTASFVWDVKRQAHWTLKAYCLQLRRNRTHLPALVRVLGIRFVFPFGRRLDLR